jgi:hypothetical protein
MPTDRAVKGGPAVPPAVADFVAALRDRLLARIATMRTRKYESRVGFGIDVAWISPGGMRLDARLHPSTASAEERRWIAEHPEDLGRAIQAMMEHDVEPAMKTVFEAHDPASLPVAAASDCWEAFRLWRTDNTAFGALGLQSTEHCESAVSKTAILCVMKATTPAGVDACHGGG